MAVNPIPEGYHSVTPYLTVSNLPRVVRFTIDVFGAKQTEEVAGDDGTVRHAEVRIGDSMIMIGQARGEWTPRPGTIYLYVEDTHATYRKALEAGAKSLMEPATQFYGDVNAGVEDADGNWWWIATRVENVSPEEMARRAKEQAK
jgi:PhnB protein